MDMNPVSSTDDEDEEHKLGDTQPPRTSTATPLTGRSSPLTLHGGSPNTTKSAESRRIILKELKKHFAISHLSSDVHQQIATVMYRCMIAPNDTVVRQGDPGDRFYIMEKGAVNVGS